MQKESKGINRLYLKDKALQVRMRSTVGAKSLVRSQALGRGQRPTTGQQLTAAAGLGIKRGVGQQACTMTPS